MDVCKIGPCIYQFMALGDCIDTILHWLKWNEVTRAYTYVGATRSIDGVLPATPPAIRAKNQQGLLRLPIR